MVKTWTVFHFRFLRFSPRKLAGYLQKRDLDNWFVSEFSDISNYGSIQKLQILHKDVQNVIFWKLF